MRHTSIILYSNNELSYTKECIDSIRSFTEKGTYEIIVAINTNITDEDLNWYINQTDIIISSCENVTDLHKVWNMTLDIAKGENLLFIHSNTVVTEKWLENLLEGLYTSQDIAAVGPLTNYQTITGQTIHAEYSSMEELLDFAKQQYLVEPIESIEMSLAISDFCFLIKRSAMLGNGLFDDMLDADSFITDFCLRLLNGGNRLAICRNIFIHHYGLFEKYNKESRMFNEKWSFELQAMDLQEDLINHIGNSLDPMSILVLGCGCGASLRRLSYLYPQAVISGIELEHSQAEIASLVGDVLSGKYLDQLNRFEESSFSHIIVTNHFFNSSNGLESLEMALGFLREDGIIVIETQNKHSYNGFKSFFSDEMNIQYKQLQPSLSEVQVFFEKNGLFKTGILPYEETLSEAGQSFFNQTKSYMSPSVQRYFNVSKFIIVAKKEPNASLIQAQFNNLITEYTPEKMEDILRYDPTFIISATKTYNGPTVPLLNLLAIESVEKKDYKNALVYLDSAYELDSRDASTLFNLGTVNYVLGDTELSLNWLLQISDRTEVVEQWISKLQSEMNYKLTNLKHLKLLLLRVEYNVHVHESIRKLTEQIQNNNARVEDLLAIIHDDIVDKRKVLNSAADYCIKNEMFGLSAILLENSLVYDPEFEATVLQLAFVYIKTGDHLKANKILNSANQKTPLINEWISKLKGSFIANS